MANADQTVSPPPAREFNLLAGLLSYLVPGLGQISQGRTGKGILFFVSIYALFFYGMYLGTGTVKANGVEYHVSGNVYLPETARQNADPRVPRFAMDLYNRPQFLGQFWVGVVAWPAIIQYASDDEQRAGQSPDEAEHIQDSRPEEAGRLRARAEQLRPGHPLFGQFERAPTLEALNALNTSRGKELELGWVYTVIAGVLNIMVIYDAIAGPAFLARKVN